MASHRSLVEAGERAPDFALPRGGHDPVRFYGVVGGEPAALVLLAGSDPEATRGLVGALHELLAGHVHVVRAGAGGAPQDNTYLDVEGRVHRAYGAATDGPAVVVLLDRNVRVSAVLPVGEDHDRLLAAARRRTDVAQGPDAIVTHQAPVLLVPGALDEALCRHVIERWESGDTVETGVETSTAAGTRTEVADAARKRRRDHTVTDPALLRTLTSHVGRRVLPEVHKAFHYHATRFEGFKIGCYDESSRGFFARHRDNLSAATAHRRFGLTLNLNDDYEGGELRFPEYGRQRYRPAAGEALVFSGSHLHEVLPVTSGRRFVLLSFVFGEDAVRR